MKNWLLLLLFTGFFTACNEKTNSAVEYNERLVSLADRITKLHDEINTVSADNVAKAEELRVQGIEVCDSVMKKIIEMGYFNGDKSFQKAALHFVYSKKKIFENDYKLLFKNFGLFQDLINSNPGSAIELQQEIDATAAGIDKKDSILFVELSGAQKTFARKYGITLNTNP